MWQRKWGLLAAVLFIVLALIPHQNYHGSEAASTNPCDPPIANLIVCENSKLGNSPSEWDIDGAGDPSIQGFATDISVNRGEIVRFKIDTDADDYRLDIYRMGYYGGQGARKVATVQPSASLPQNQPNCLTDPSTGLIDCGNWAVSASWAIPADAISGIYFAKLIREDGDSGSSHIVFVVRDDNGGSDLLFQTSDTTWQAYNNYGGNSLYVGGPGTNPGRAYEVSYNRPFNTRAFAPEDWVFNSEYPMVRWLEANGYDVSYSTGIDSDRRGAEIREHRVFLSVGHDEYWSAAQRANVEAARNAGVHLSFFSGNEIFWKVRWDTSIDGSGTPYRTLVSYKETHANAKIDPLPNVWTGTWRDPRFSPPADGNRPENALTGTIFTVNCCSYPIEVPASDGKMRFWRNTSIASLVPGQIATLPENTLGYEWDEDLDNGFRPAGLIRLSSTTVDVPQRILDHGSTYGSGTATHSITLYRHSSGALVFGAGTVQWSWGLDADHDRGSSTPDVRMQQATVNLFADMDVQPDTLQAGLVAATASTDTTAPNTTINTPANNASVQVGTPVSITGTASDSGGGVVGGVEVSVNGGATWHPASGRTTWSHSWVPNATGTVAIQSRAIDDSGNIETSPASVTVNVGTQAPPPTCPCSLWSNATTPSVAAENDGDAVELGVKFQSTVNGYITGLRFYKGPGNTGTHIGHLWTAGGSLLASATFTNETSSGWQQVTLPSPVAITANTTYVASYHAPTGHYAVDNSYFDSTFTNSPLRALADGSQGGNGVYRYGAGGFPTESYQASNYWVDVVFTTSLPPDNTPPTISNTSISPNATNVSVGANVTVTFSEGMNAATINGNTIQLHTLSGTLIATVVTYDSVTGAATLNPNANLQPETTYRVTVRGGANGVKDLSGNALSGDVTWTFTTGQLQSCPCSLWSSSATPAVPSDPDTQAIEVGVKFRSDVDGYVTALRFYKGSGNTGTHVGHLWTATGALLASVTFTNETASGWQQSSLATPVAITANTTYVASYHTTRGRYALDEFYFDTSSFANPPLQALEDGEDGPNGVYKYGNSGFPTESFGGSNYWVDVVFNTSLPPDTTAPSVSAVFPNANSVSVGLSTSLTVTFNEAINSSTINSSTVQLRNPENTLIASSVTYNAGTRTATVNPNADLAPLTTYTATVKGGSSGVKDPAGNAMAADFSWSFTSVGSSPDQGPGGPILVITTPSNPFTRYYAEILRTEGFNTFAVQDISSVSGSSLTAFDVVILGEMPLTSSQVTMFSNWVNAGGNLIAMRPDKDLATLLGLTATTSTLANGYLLVNTASGAGLGIVNETVQFHSTADRYTLNGATSVATLYSNATTATANPAVTLRSVGSNGGQAAAFTFDLARSIVYMRQGNPAWEGQERDGVSPIRSDDLFYGAASGDLQPDWVNLNKVVIPQADEQQRLLANLILHMNHDRKPLPRFWYFPHGHKAVVIMTGDDHATGGTAGRFDQHLASSPSGCSVNDWECVRSTSYIYPGSPLSDAAAAEYIADGFEVALHVSTGCANYTPSSLESFYSDQLDTFAADYPSVPSPSTNRTHCIVWSDYATQAKVELDHGIRLDTTYYYYPPSWVANRAGFFTGSGMPMRFADLDGSFIDVYQAATQMTDESGQAYPFTANSLLDKALGAEGYYGAFTANMHTDHAELPDADAVVASALARNVPVVSSRQMLIWLDGRNASSFGSVNWSGSTLSFAIAVGTGARGLQTMVPTTSKTGSLVSLTRNNNPVSYTTRIIKGREYAFFPAVVGTYAATYGSDTTQPTVAVISVPNGTTNVDPTTSISVTFSESMDPATINSVTFVLKDAAGNTVPAAVFYDAATKTATLDPNAPLNPGTTYTATLKGGSQGVKDAAGNAMAVDVTWSFTTSAPVACPCSLWNDAMTPAVAAANDTSAVELGVKFRSQSDGYIVALRFYKGPGNTGIHVGKIWTRTGTQLASVTFTNETASGWQQAILATPVPVTANTTYVASYHTTVGRYAANSGYFTSSPFTNAPLQALVNGADGSNGVYRYGASAFPDQSFNASNYWVDVVFNTAPSFDNTPPTVTTVSPTSAATNVEVNANITATFSEGMDAATITGATFSLRDEANVLVNAVVTYDADTRRAILTPNVFLNEDTTYTARLRGTGSGVKDVAGNPLAADFSWLFTTRAGPPPSVGDTSVGHFTAGSFNSNVAIADMDDGEVILAPAAGTDFTGASLPSGWQSTVWNSGGAATVASDQLTVDGASAGTVALFGPGRALEFTATFSGAAFQHVGFALTFNEALWAIFSTGSGGNLYARSRSDTVNAETLIPGNWLGSPHHFRIEWTSANIIYAIDGTVVASHTGAIAQNMRPLASDYNTGGGTVVIDWLRLSPYIAAGTFTSRVLDAGQPVNWDTVTWTSIRPEGAGLTVSLRTGNTAVPDGTWTNFSPVAASGNAIGGNSRYIQYRVELTTMTPNGTPVFQGITFVYSLGTP
jgi:hypothetical protein